MASSNNFFFLSTGTPPTRRHAIGNARRPVQQARQQVAPSAGRRRRGQGLPPVEERGAPAAAAPAHLLPWQRPRTPADRPADIRPHALPAAGGHIFPGLLIVPRREPLLSRGRHVAPARRWSVEGSFWRSFRIDVLEGGTVRELALQHAGPHQDGGVVCLA